MTSRSRTDGIWADFVCRGIKGTVTREGVCSDHGSALYQLQWAYEIPKGCALFLANENLPDDLLAEVLKAIEILSIAEKIAE